VSKHVVEPFDLALIILITGILSRWLTIATGFYLFDLLGFVIWLSGLLSLRFLAKDFFKSELQEGT
jgi:hypothetical protein